MTDKFLSLSPDEQQTYNSILHDLQQLKYPYLISITSPTNIIEQGEIRHILLCWLFTQYDSTWNTNKEDKDAETVRMTNFASTMGLCGQGDVALLKVRTHTRTCTLAQDVIMFKTEASAISVSYQLHSEHPLGV